jgi:hypothetical protein
MLLHHTRSFGIDRKKLTFFLIIAGAAGIKLLKKTMPPNSEMRAGMVGVDCLVILPSKSIIVNFCASRESIRSQTELGGKGIKTD